MKDTKGYEDDLASIRATMERSVKFMSLSGLSGILAGIFALAGAAYAYALIYYPSSPFGFRLYIVEQETTVIKLVVTAALVLALSLATAFFLSHHKAKKLGVNVWNKPSKLLLINLLIPLIAGGLFTVILVSRGYYMIFSSTTLIFYGLALVSASQFTFKEVRYLGFTEIILGLVSATMPGFGLLFWAAGFGLLHIIYGSIMHYRYDR